MAGYTGWRIDKAGASGTIVGFPAIRVEIDLDEIKGLRTDANWKMIDDFIETGTEFGAEAVANKARWLLDPANSSRDIGTTGRASRNIFVRQTVNQEGKSVHEIYEGVYPANYFIRMGRGKGERPYSRDIVQWIVDKGVTVYPPKKQKKKWRITKAGGPRARGGPPRPFKRDLRQVAAVIGNKINELGLAHLKEFEPPGKPKYDYYGEIMKNKRWLRRILYKHFDVWAKLYVKFLKSGQYRRVPIRGVEALRGD